MTRKIWNPAWLGSALIILATLLAYWPALQAGFIWDDDSYVTENGALRTLKGLGFIWFKIGTVPQYYPLVHTGFWLEYQLWGLNPLGFHLVNILLHAAAAVLLAFVLMRLKISGAWLVAAIFALHPVHVESVAWITERKNVLSAVFYLSAAVAYFRFTELKDQYVSGSKLWRVYIGALLLFVCALWSKTVTCSLPAALLLVRWWKQGRLRSNDVVPLLPFFAVGAGLALLTVWMEKHVVGASGATWVLSFLDRCLIAGRALWFYAGKLLWPVELTFIYPKWQINTAVWWQWIFPVAALAVVAGLWLLRKRIGRGPLVAVLFFAGTLFPALGFIDVYPFRYSFVADHFQYHASIGLIVLAAVGLHRALRTTSRATALKPALYVLPLVLAVFTWKQTHIYHDLETLWRDTLAKNPSSAIAHNNLGALLSARGDSEAAEQHYRRALELEPDDGETMSNLGVILAGQGEAELALELLEKAVAFDPDNAEIHSNRGKVLARLGRYDDAIAAFEHAKQLRPHRPEFYYNHGTVLADMGKLDQAADQFRQALALMPDYADAHNNLGLALAGQGKHDDAIRHYFAALGINPAHAVAHNNLGNALMWKGNVDEAVRHLREALRLNPNYANAHFNLGNAFALQKKYEDAVTEFKTALQLKPGDPLTHRNLGLALVRLGRREEAVQQFNEALRFQPDYEPAKQQLRALGVAVPE